MYKQALSSTIRDFRFQTYILKKDSKYQRLVHTMKFIIPSYSIRLGIQLLARTVF